jgi:hypothetical protein
MSGRSGQDLMVHGHEANRLPLASASTKMNSRRWPLYPVNPARVLPEPRGGMWLTLAGYRDNNISVHES